MAEEEPGVLSSFFKLNGESDSSDGEVVAAAAEQRAEPQPPPPADEPQVPAESSFASPRLRVPVTIVQDQAKGIGFQLWPAASFLCRYLEEHLPADQPATALGLTKPMADLTCLELGAGVGLVGLFCAGLGCRRAVVTDLAEVLPILHENVTANSDLTDRVVARALAWGSDDWRAVAHEAPPDLILLADCVYWPQLFTPLIETLHALCSTTGAVCLMAHVRRWKRDGKFFAQCGKLLDVTKMHEVAQHEECAGTLTDEDVESRIVRSVMRIYRIQAKADAGGRGGRSAAVATPPPAAAAIPDEQHPPATPCSSGR